MHQSSSTIVVVIAIVVGDDDDDQMMLTCNCGDDDLAVAYAEDVARMVRR